MSINFQYPVLPSGENPTEKELEQMASFYFGENNRFGSYLLSYNMTAHGGLHIEGRADKVHAIADGRIIAFRLPEKYLHDTSPEKLQYSNAFVLIQHEYTSTENESGKSQKLRFYSLYMHLMPQEELEKDQKNIPDWCVQYFAKVKTNSVPLGIKLRQYDTSEEGKSKKSKEVIFLPKGTIIEEDTITCPPDGHFLYTEGGKGYVLCTYNNINYIAARSWLTSLEGNSHQVCHDKPTDKNTYDKDAAKGTMLFDAINGNYIGMECYNDEVEVEYTNNKEWYKIVGSEAFVRVKECDLKLRRSIANTVEASTKVQNVDIPVKAGDFIGKPSKYQSQTATYYDTVHLEVFTDDANLKDVYNNSLGLNDKMIYEVDKGKTLQIAKPCNFLTKDLRTKIYNADKDNFTQIGFEDVTCDIDDKTVELVDPNKKKKIYVNGKLEKKWYYTIAPEHFDTINAKLNGCLPNATTEVYLIKNLGGNKRKIGFSTPLSGKKFWVKKTQATGEKNTWINLSDNIDAYYEEVPNDDTKDTTIEKKVRIRKKKSFKVANLEWWKIETKDKNDNEGYIKKSDLIELNAYDFKDFNWQIIEDAGTNYFYMFGKYVEESAPKPFVQKIWDAIGNGNKKYTVYELREAMKDVANREILSRIIFKHPSEWAMKNKKDAFKQEYLKICEKGINEAKGKDKETDTETRKEKLTRIRDERWDILEDKVEKLSFWDEVKNGDLQPVAKRKQEYIDKHKSGRVSMLPDSENKEYKKLGDKFDKLEAERSKRFFPKDDNVYHLHPLGFVQHMKIICRQEIDSKYFFTQYDIEFNKGKPEDKKKYLSSDNKKSLQKMFDGIADYYEKEKRDINLVHISYMFATAKHETADTFNPIKEYGGKSYYEKMYDPVLGKSEKRRNMAKRNGNTTQGDGVKYCGRGFVQLTWKDNYQKMKTKFGVDFVNDMDKALEHELAMKIMIYGMEKGTFTGKKLSNYLNDTKKDFYNARRIINGTDKAQDIADYSKKMEKCLKLK